MRTWVLLMFCVVVIAAVASAERQGKAREKEDKEKGKNEVKGKDERKGGKRNQLKVDGKGNKRQPTGKNKLEKGNNSGKDFKKNESKGGKRKDRPIKKKSGRGPKKNRPDDEEKVPRTQPRRKNGRKKSLKKKERKSRKLVKNIKPKGDCPGECVAPSDCKGRLRRGTMCEGDQVCCVPKRKRAGRKGTTVKRFCKPLTLCNEKNGECRKKKTGCNLDEKRYKNKKNKSYCDKKSCVCCVRQCSERKKCLKAGGTCMLKKSAKKLCADGDFIMDKKYCDGKKCGCCVPSGGVDTCKQKKTCTKAGGSCVPLGSSCSGGIQTTNSKGKSYCKGSCGCCLTDVPPTDAPPVPPTEAPPVPPTEAPPVPPTEAPPVPPTDAPPVPPTDAPPIPPTDAPTIPPTDAPTIPPTDAPTIPPTNPPTTTPPASPTTTAKPTTTVKPTTTPANPTTTTVKPTTTPNPTTTTVKPTTTANPTTTTVKPTTTAIPTTTTVKPTTTVNPTTTTVKPTTTANPTTMTVKPTTTANPTTTTANPTTTTVRPTTTSAKPTTTAPPTTTTVKPTTTAIPTTTTAPPISRAYCPDCGVAQVAVDGVRIVNGTAAAANEYPYQVIINPTIGGTTYQCGGSIIKKRWILTAAHCFFDSSQNQAAQNAIRVGYGSSNRISLIFVDATRYIIHENYNPAREDFDIALIELPSDLDYEADATIQPMCLAEASDIVDGGKAVVTGWGTQVFGGTSTPNDLQEVALDIISTAQCQGLTGLPADTSAVVCALTAYKDSCQGDSGGPLVVRVGPNLWAQIGIVSYGVGCADPTKPGVYTRVPSYRTWIDTNTGSQTAC